jgi:hypothetical protein
MDLWRSYQMRKVVVNIEPIGNIETCGGKYE